MTLRESTKGRMAKTREWNLADAGPLGPWMPERSEKKKILPRQAEWLLEHCNTHNRPIVNASVKVVEDALNGGTWECNGETIIFAYDSTLLDGQNRLWGCVNSGKPLLTWVHFGLQNKEAFMTIDRGRNRTGQSDLGILGEANPRDLSAVLLMLTAYDNGMRSSSIVHSPRADTRVLLATLAKHPGVRESVRWSVNHRIKITAPQRIVGFTHYLAGISGNSKVLARRDEFFARLADGVGLEEDSPILTLRNKWYGMQSNPNVRTRVGMGRGLTYVYLWTLVRAWNAFLMGHKLGKIQISFKDEAKTMPTDIPDVRSYFRRPSDKITDEEAADAAIHA